MPEKGRTLVIRGEKKKASAACCFRPTMHHMAARLVRQPGDHKVLTKSRVFSGVHSLQSISRLRVSTHQPTETGKPFLHRQTIKRRECSYKQATSFCTAFGYGKYLRNSRVPCRRD